ncbi:MAG TPA: hypothetical protein DCM87_03145 [Planctomycetes bacterium]|nr:hypothetical protein [Planctomycetota bacterium]
MWYAGNSRVGLDIGTHMVRAAQVVRAGKRYAVTRILKIPRDELPRDDQQAFARELRARMGAAGIPVARVVVGLPPQASIVRYSTAPPAPPWRLSLLVQYEVDELAERMGEKLCAGWRKHTIGGEGAERPLLLVLGKEKEIQTLLDALRGAGFGIASVMPPVEGLLWAWRSFVEPAPGEGLDALVEIGEKNTHLVMLLEGELFYARQAVFGGQQFNEALAERVRATPQELERVKRASTGLDQDGSKMDFSEVFARPAEQLANLVRGTLKWAEGQIKLGKPALSRVLLTGGGAQLRGLSRHLARSLGAEVLRAGANDAVAVAGSELPGGPEGFLPAMGLGAAGFAPEDVLEVLPVREKERRRFWNEKAFLYGAAGLLVGFLALQLAAGFAQSTVRSSRLASLRTQADSLTKASADAEETRKEQRSLERRIGALVHEAARHGFTGRLLGFLGERLAPQIQLAEIRELRAKDRRAQAAVEIEGLADNANNEATRAIEELERALKGQPYVGSVQLMQASPEVQKNAYRFVIKVSMAAAERPEGGADA